MSRVSICSGIFLFFVLAGAVAGPLSLAWRYPTGGQIRSSPVVGPDHTILAISDDGFLYAFSSAGRVKWACNLGGLVGDSLSVGSDGTAYAGLLNGNVDAVNPRGKIIWQFDAGGQLLGNPAVASDGTVFVAITAGTLYSVSISGTLEWKITLPAKMTAPPVLDNQETLFLGGSDGRLYALTRWGRFEWSLPLPGVPREAAVASDGSIYLLTSSAGTDRLVRVSLDGNVMWSHRIAAGSSGVLLGQGQVFTMSSSGEVMAFQSSGSLEWQRNVGKTVSGAWLLYSGGLAVMGADKALSIIDQKSGAVIRRERLDAEGSLGFGDDELLVGGRDWLVYGYGPAKPDTAAEWPQGSADSRHSSRARGRLDQTAVNSRLSSIPDYLAMSLQLEPSSRDSLMSFLAEVTRRIDDGTLAKSTWYVRRLLERTVGVGVLNPIVEGNSVVNDFPGVRAQAAALLGQLGSLDGRSVLIRTLSQETDAFAASKEIAALGAIGSDSDGEATGAIAEAVNKFSSSGGGGADRVALAAVGAIRSIAHYEGEIPSPAGGIVLLSIYRGQYPPAIREAALAALRTHSP